MSWRSSGWRVLAWIEAFRTRCRCPRRRPRRRRRRRRRARSRCRPFWHVVVTSTAREQRMKERQEVEEHAWTRWLLVVSGSETRVTEVDGGQDREDECLQAGDQDRLEQEDRDPERQQHPGTHGSPTSTPSSPPMNAISMWPASRLAHSRTVSEISRRKYGQDLDHEDQRHDRAVTPPGIRLLR